MIKLRDYQRMAIDAVKRDWEHYSDVLVVLATGGGKTAVFLALLHEVLGPTDRALILAHTKELIEQPRDRLLSYYPDWQGRVGIVMAEQDQCDAQITVATVQTLVSERRLARLLEAGPITHLVVDECFPAGTLVDGRPIETVRVGDTVLAYDYVDGILRYRRVARLFKRPAPDRLLRIVAGGRTLVCTPNHPLLVNESQWIEAAYVGPGDYLEDAGNEYQPEGVCCLRQDLPAAQLEQSDDAHLFTGVQSGATCWTSQTSGAAMRRMRAASRMSGTQRIRNGAQGTSLLLGGVQAGLSQTEIIGDDGAHESPLCQRAHEAEQSDGRLGSQGEDASQAEGARLGDWRTWRQRVYNATAGNVGRCAALADGGRYTDRQNARTGLSDMLQGGHRPCGVQDCCGGGWQDSQATGTPHRRCQEGRSPHGAWVDSVEVLERGRGDEFERVCPDGFVYNLEVEGLHTYTANGFVVHNCHHATAETYGKIWRTLRDYNPQLRHLGVTATPLRTDGAGLRAVYQHVAYKAGIRELVRLGWLVPPRWLAIQTGISLAGVPKHDGDFTQKRLADVYETANCFELVVRSHQQYADGRRALAFTSSVKGAYDLAQHFNDAGIPAAAADGTTPKPERANILRAFRNGELQVLCNMNLFTEGLDVPEVSCIHQVRPTQSDLVYTQMLGRALRPVPGKEDALILDYAPLEARNVVMAGDVLGVEARKDAYIAADQAEGAVIGGFTFDGNVKWLNGSPMELISRSLDYLHASPWVWERGADGWLILPLGVADDGVDRTLALSPVADSMTLYLVAKRPDEQYPQAYQVKAGTFEALSAWADAYAAQRGQASIAAKARQWRKAPPTDKQILYGRRLRVFEPGMSRGALAAAITRSVTMRTLRMGGFVEM